MSTTACKEARILVVDDEEPIREMLADALAGPEVAVDTAASGSAAELIARSRRPDLLVADLHLGDCDGLELLRRLRGHIQDLPVVIISGHGNAERFSEASACRPVLILNKPLDVARLREAAYGELKFQQTVRRQRRVRSLTRRVGRKRREAYRALSGTCDELNAACQALQNQMGRQEELIRYQTDLLGCNSEYDAFGRFFRLFVQRSGPVHGVALLCDENAELQMVGRFGVPVPDGVNFCRTLAMATVDSVLENPQVAVFDAYDERGMFPQAIHQMLVGLTVMPVPLLLDADRMIGLVVLYRKGEQPFTDDDQALAQMLSRPTASVIQRI